jgi:hypothetical protein
VKRRRRGLAGGKRAEQGISLGAASGHVCLKQFNKNFFRKKLRISYIIAYLNKNTKGNLWKMAFC